MWFVGSASLFPAIFVWNPSKINADMVLDMVFAAPVPHPQNIPLCYGI